MTWSLDPEHNETQMIHRLVPFDGRDVLEIGCGDGRLTWRYAEHAASVLAIDPDQTQLAIAQNSLPEALRRTVRFAPGDIVVDRLPDAAFDIALFSWSI